MFTIAPPTKKRFGANFTLAVALMGSVAIGSVALEAPASAQRDRAAQPQYSDGFRQAYNPVNELAQGDAAAKAQARTQIPTLVAALETPDDRNAAGGLIYNLGTELSDRELQYQGMRMMLDSGKVPAENLGRYNMTGYQIASALENGENTRHHLQAMIDSGFSFDATMSDGSTRTLAADDYRMLIANSYFQDEDVDAGLDYISQQIAAREAEGATIPESWITRGLSVAYENERGDRAVDFSNLFVANYPSQTSWGDALAIQRNLNNYDNPAILDLLRLGYRTNSLRQERDYIEFVETADARRLPGEVKEVLDQGVAAGIVDPSDVYISEARQTAQARIAEDQSDLPALERDARAADARVNIVMAAGDAFLSYDQPAKAEEFYSMALDKPGVDTPVAMTRLGIAQADQGKSAQAIETFGKVQGVREPIARLWATYAAQQSSASATTSTEATVAPTGGM